MSRMDKNSSGDTFIKDLSKIQKSNQDIAFKILEKISQLSQVAHEIRENKNFKTNLKVKRMKGQSYWQLRVDDYRVWYDFDENDELQFIKVFKKDSKKTPKRFIDNAAAKHQSDKTNVAKLKHLYESESAKKKLKAKDNNTEKT